MQNLDFIEKKQISVEKVSKKSFKKWLFFLAFFFFLLVLVLAVGAAYAWYEIYVPADRNNAEGVRFTVEQGQGVKEIGAALEQENFIRSEFWFKAHVWLEGQSANLQAGEYSLSPSMNVPDILQIITGGKVVFNEVKITFPEGFTIKQIKTRLLENDLQSAEGFDRELVDGFQVQYKFLGAVNEEKSLEGFLFPDTYHFKKDVKKGEIIKKFLENFDRKLTPAMRAEIDRQGKSIYEIVTLASIVQQEAYNEEEMPMIAGVFQNRLEIGMLLQSDATVNYATGKTVRRASAEDLKINSPYNSYIYAGLPPTPICNPGEAAIKAAIYQQESDYLYFLHPLNSPAVYSKTLDEHHKNEAKYLK